MQIKPPGLLSRGKIILDGPAPHITPEALCQELARQWEPQGYSVYQSKLIGLDVALKKSGWSGVAIKIKQDGTGTVLAYNAFSPSAMVRMLAMGLIPILIINAKSWKPLLRSFESYIQGSQFFGGTQQQLGQGQQQAQGGYQQQPQQGQQQAQAGYQQQQQPQAQAGYQQQQPQAQAGYQQQQPQAQAGYQQQQPQAQEQPQAQQQYPCQQCQTPLQWVAEHQRWYCGGCQQYK